ncbi:Kinesin-like protein kif19 [Homalodisca vitripennis]|nr:Kinesin-like protein kif19 [Homalodisca vitripennis]
MLLIIYKQSVKAEDSEIPRTKILSKVVILKPCYVIQTILVEEDKNDVLRQKRSSERKYVFDMAFGEDSTQEQVYVATTRGLVRDVLRGYNATVFAYGATGAGKTHTMVGSSQEPGIMVRALNDLFHTIDKQGHDYSVSLSYLEIYNENIRDLLNPSSGALELRDDSRGRNIVVAGLTEITANSTQEVMALLHRGNKSRTVEPTAANQTSSRSHALLPVTVRRWSFQSFKIGVWFYCPGDGSTAEREQIAHSGAHGSQSDVLQESRTASGYRPSMEFPIF